MFDSLSSGLLPDSQILESLSRVLIPGSLQYPNLIPFKRSACFSTALFSFGAVCSCFSNALFPFERFAPGFSNTLVPFGRFAPGFRVLYSLSSGLLESSSPFRAVCSQLLKHSSNSYLYARSPLSRPRNPQALVNPNALIGYVSEHCYSACSEMLCLPAADCCWRSGLGHSGLQLWFFRTQAFVTQLAHTRLRFLLGGTFVPARPKSIGGKS